MQIHVIKWSCSNQDHEQVIHLHGQGAWTATHVRGQEGQCCLPYGSGVVFLRHSPPRCLPTASTPLRIALQVHLKNIDKHCQRGLFCTCKHQSIHPNLLCIPILKCQSVTGKKPGALQSRSTSLKRVLAVIKTCQPENCCQLAYE